MNSLGKAWLLESGEYSDYRVHAVCLNEETARASASLLGVDVSEVLLLNTVEDAPKISTYRVIQYLNANGQLLNSEPSTFHELSDRRGVHAWVIGPAKNMTGAGVEVRAGDHASAVKAAREYAAELGAEIAAGVSVADAVRAFNERRDADARS